jgi:hypothetical protein
MSSTCNGFQVVANFVEACDRYAIHRRLKLESAQLYSGLTKKEKEVFYMTG